MACECDTQEPPSSPTRQTQPQQQHEKSGRRPSPPSSSSPLPLSPKRSHFSPMDAARNPRSCGLAAVLVEGAESRGRVLLGMRRLRLPPEKGSPAIEFGVKNRDSRLALLSPVQRSPAARSELQAEEEYTCVIARGGPNPSMTHIFHGRAVVQSSCHGCSCQLTSCCCDNNNRAENAFVVNKCSYTEVFLDKGIRDTPDGEKLKA